MKKKLAVLLAAVLLLAAAAGCLPSGKVVDAWPETCADAVSGPAEEPFSGAHAETPAEEGPALPEDGSYTSREDVALYLYLYGRLPDNFMTKAEAQALGWEARRANLWEVAVRAGQMHWGRPVRELRGIASGKGGTRLYRV